MDGHDQDTASGASFVSPVSSNTRPVHANANGKEEEYKSVPNGPCAVCKKPSTLSCSNCGSDGGPDSARVYYCSREHQSLDWKSHRQVCQPWKAVKVADDSNSSGLSRIVHYEARRGLPEPGSQIMTRQPLLVYPCAVSADIVTRLPAYPEWVGVYGSPDAVLKAIRPCVGCCGILTYDRVYFEEGDESGAKIGACPNCKWPLHNATCGASSDHDQECRILTNRTVLPTGGASEVSEYTKLGVLRAVLLKSSRPEDFAQLLSMPYSVHIQPDFRAMEEVEDFVMRDCGMRHAVDKQTLARIFQILLANCQRINYSFHHITHKFAYVIFKGEQGRILPHSCAPNCQLAVDPTSFIGVVRTIKQVEAGARFTLTYASPDMAYKDRIMELMQLGMYHKNCPRCASPDEGGSHFSSITCTQCRGRGDEGLLLPNYNGQNSWIWRCNMNPTHSMSEGEVNYLFHNFFATISGLGQGRQGLNKAELIGQMIDQFVPAVFHENLYIVLLARKMITKPAMEAMRELGQYMMDENIPMNSLQTMRLKPSAFVYHTRIVFMRELKKILDMGKELQTGFTLDHVDYQFHYTLLCMSELAAARARAEVKTSVSKGLEQKLESWTATLSKCLRVLKCNRSLPADEVEERVYVLHFYVKHLENELGLDANAKLQHFVKLFTISPKENVTATLHHLVATRKGKRVVYLNCDWNKFRNAFGKQIQEELPDAGTYATVRPCDVTLHYTETSQKCHFLVHGRYLTVRGNYM